MLDGKFEALPVGYPHPVSQGLTILVFSKPGKRLASVRIRVACLYREYPITVTAWDHRIQLWF